MQNERIWSVPVVCAQTGLARSSVYRLEAAGQFPARIQITSKRVGWLASEILEWIESRPRAKSAQQ